MSTSNFPRRGVGDAIDRAVRDMMQIDPRPGLRRRVLTRIERSSGPWALGSLGPWVRRTRASTVLFPAAALIAIVVTLIIPALRERPIEVAQAPAPQASAAPSAPPAAPAASLVPGAPGSARARSESVFGPRRDRVSAASIDRPPAPSSAVGPFGVEDLPSGLTPIVLGALPRVAEIRVAPIEIQRITLPALPPSR